MVKATKQRCDWGTGDPLYQAYHDEEWGVPLRDEHALFEFLILEGAQAGLSWITILKKRDRYRKVFSGFDPVKVARFRPDKIERLLADPGIIRNRLKVAGAVKNAKAFLQVQKEFGSFSSYIWAFVGNKPKQNRFKSMSEMPAETEISHAMSKDLKRRGFTFVGPTICYAFMQAVGMVNDHVTSCYRHREVKKL